MVKRIIRLFPEFRVTRTGFRAGAGLAVLSLSWAATGIAATDVLTSLQAGTSQRVLSDPVGPLSDALAGTDSSGNSPSSSFAMADFGAHEVDAEATSFDNRPTAAFGFARFRDDVTITPDDPTLHGTEGRIVFALRPLGVLEHRPTGFDPMDSAEGIASWRLAVSGADQPNEYAGQLILSPGPNGFGTEERFENTPLGTVLTFEHSVFFGFPTQIEMLLNTQVSVAVSDFAPQEAAHAARAGAAVAWEGIAEVRDGFGNVVTAYSVSSGSGVDWSQPVPEPGLPATILAGLMGLVGATSRRR